MVNQTLAPIILKKEDPVVKFSKTKFGKILTSPKTTLVLGSIAATLATGGAAAGTFGAAGKTFAKSLGRTAASAGKKIIPKSVPGAIKTIAGAGVVAGLGISGIKEVAKKTFETGKTGGEIIAGEKNIKDLIGSGEGEKILTKENLVKAAKAAGIIGAGALGVAGVKKIIDKAKEGKEGILTEDKPTLGTLEKPLPAQIGVSSLQAPQVSQAQSLAPVSSGAQAIDSSGNQKSPLTIVQIDL